MKRIGEQYIGGGRSGDLISRWVEFGDAQVLMTSSGDGSTFDVGPYLRDPDEFHGSHQVHAMVNFGTTLQELRGHHEDRDGFFKNRDALLNNGVVILSDWFDEASLLVEEIDTLAQALGTDSSMYDDPVTASKYFELARQGYQMQSFRLPMLGDVGRQKGVPVSLERAGLVTTRLAVGVRKNKEVPGEVRVVTKRAHPKDGDDAELMVTVKLRDPDQLASLNGEMIDLADFVNPASWASTAALLLVLRERGIRPAGIIHRSIMATTQGIIKANNVVKQMGMRPIFYSIGTSNNMNDLYYLSKNEVDGTGHAVGDAGRILRHYLPKGYSAE